MTRSKRRLLGLSVALPLFVLPVLRAADAVPAAASEPAVKRAEASQFLRFVDQGGAGGRLETADVTYRNADGVTVRLVSAVHIGEKSYFEGLAKSFDGDDAVLYELIKPKDAPAPAPGAAPRRDPAAVSAGVGDLQRFLKDTLNLEFQLDQIDYTKANFVHADMDVETFERRQAERGESFATLMLKGMIDAMSKPQPEQAVGDPDQVLRELIQVVTRPDTERQVKLLIARHLVDIEAHATGLGGSEGSVILTERNTAAMKVLKDTISGGKKKISVFYGAAHMPDLANQLVEMGFEPATSEWRLAWDLNVREDQPSAVENVLMDVIKALGEE